MTLTFQEIKDNYQLFTSFSIKPSEASEHIQTIFQKNDLFLLDKMKRVNLYETTLIEAFKKGDIYPNFTHSYFELFEPAIKLAQEFNIDLNYNKLFYYLIQNKDKRCIFTYFEQFNQKLDNITVDTKKQTLEYLIQLPTSDFNFYLELFQQNENFFNFYQKELVNLAFQKLDPEYNHFSNILSNIYSMVKKNLSIEPFENLSTLLLDWVEKEAESNISQKRRDFYDNCYYEEGANFVADLSDIFAKNRIEFIKQTFLMYQKQGAINSEFIEQYKENQDYFQELGLDYSYWDKNGHYHDGDFLLNCEKAVLERSTSLGLQARKIKL